MASPEGPRKLQAPENDNIEKYPPESFEGRLNQLLHTSHFANNGAFDQEMIDAVSMGQTPEYDTNTPEGLKKKQSYEQLLHFKEIFDNPESFESARGEAFRELHEYAKKRSAQ